MQTGPFLFYGVFSGFNGGDETAKYVMNQLVNVIFMKQPITITQKPEDIVSSLKQKYAQVVQEYLQTQSDMLSNHLLVKENISKHMTIEEIDEKISRGTTLIAALIINNNLYLISCGRSIALIIEDGRTRPIQLNDTLHENTDKDEIDRIINLQVDPDTVKNPTRAIGDLHRSHLYMEMEEFKHATGPPVISEPLVQHHLISENWKFLILLSDGVVDNLRFMNVDIPLTVMKCLRVEQTPRNTAQALVDAFSRNHSDYVSRDENTHSSDEVVEEMTVLFHELGTYRSLASTIESTNDSGIMSTSTFDGVPYVDADHSSESENFKLMEQYILKTM